MIATTHRTSHLLPRTAHTAVLLASFIAVFLAAGDRTALAATPRPAPDPTSTAATSSPSPPARRFAELMEALDSNDPSRIRAYVAEAFAANMRQANPGDDGIDEFLINQQKLGGFAVHHALVTAVDQVEMLVRARGGSRRWLRYVVKVTPEPPHPIEGLFVFPAAPDTIPREGERLDPAAAVAELGRQLEEIARDGAFSGVVLLAKDGQPLLHRALGEADRGLHVANRPDTLFSLASVGKMFTAVAVGKLVAAGRLGWDDPLGRHLQGWLPEDVAGQITLRMLLNHTSGLGDFLGALRSGDTLRLLDGVAAHQTLVTGARPTFPPGSDYQYSNVGFLLLGAVIEAVSGEDFYTFVREQVFAPAGMPRSGYFAIDEVIENRAQNYLAPGEGAGDNWRTNIRLHGLRGTPAGGAYASADELLAFANALTSYRLIDRATTETLLAGRTRTPMGGYGLGFIVDKAPGGGDVVGHLGGFPGVGAALRIYRESGFTLVVLTNTSRGVGEVVGAWEALLPRVE